MNLSSILTIRGIATVVSVAIAMTASVAGAQQACGEWAQVDPPAGTALAFTDVEARSATDAFALDPAWGLTRWDGASWSQLPIPEVLGSYSNVALKAIRLIGPTDLFLSGQGITGPFSSDVILKTWDGTSWSDWDAVTLQPQVGGAPRNGSANAVVGVAIDDVWLLGQASGMGIGVGNLPLTVHWDGSQLTEFLSPRIGDTRTDLFDAAAIATDDIWAVGLYRNLFTAPLGYHGATYHWDGSSWSAVPNPTDATSFNLAQLNAVTAIASDDVWAAGSEGNGPLFMHWDGTEWTIVPAPATTGTIQAIAAIASDDVWAVDFAAQVPVIGKYYHWDGVAWSIVIPPAIPGATNVNRHGGIAAAGPCEVWAVGSIDYGSGLGPFFERLQPGSGATAAPALASEDTWLLASPNPLAHSTRIRFAIPGEVASRAEIYNVRGRRVRALFDEPIAGTAVTWDGRDDTGEHVPGGVYFLRVESREGRVFTEKLTVAR